MKVTCILLKKLSNSVKLNESSLNFYQDDYYLHGSNQNFFLGGS